MSKKIVAYESGNESLHKTKEEADMVDTIIEVQKFFDGEGLGRVEDFLDEAAINEAIPSLIKLLKAKDRQIDRSLKKIK